MFHTCVIFYNSSCMLALFTKTYWRQMKKKTKKFNDSKPQTLIEKYNAIQAIGSSIETPHEVFCLFKDFRTMDVVGDQISFGEDYVSLEGARSVLDYLVQQLGGKVEWS